MITLKWDPDLEAAILWEMETGWTWDDFHAAITDCKAMIDERQPSLPTCMILLLGSWLASGAPFTPIARGMREIAKFNGIVIVVTKNQLHRRVISTVRKVTPEGSRLYAAESLDDARTQVSKLIRST